MATNKFVFCEECDKWCFELCDDHYGCEDRGYCACSGKRIKSPQFFNPNNETASAASISR
jgi:hypothetical protein